MQPLRSRAQQGHCTGQSAHGLAAWFPGGPRRECLFTGVQLQSTGRGDELHCITARLPAWGNALAQCLPTEVGEDMLTPEPQPSSVAAPEGPHMSQMPTWHLGRGPEPERGRVFAQSPLPVWGTVATALPLPTSPAQGGGGQGAGQEPRGRSADCRPAQGSVMSWRVLGRGRGPCCFSGELEPQ